MLGASKLLIFLLNDDDNMQGGESCRNICVVPFSLCKTTTLRVEPSLLLCNLHKRHQILIIFNITTANSAIINSVCSLSSLWLNLMAGVDSTSSPPLCQHYDDDCNFWNCKFKGSNLTFIHSWRVLSAPTGPIQALNPNWIFTKEENYRGRSTFPFSSQA